MTIQERYRLALDTLVERLREDRTVLAVILAGSLAYDEVWEKSDIDLILVMSEDLKSFKHTTLLADGICAHAIMTPRSKFKSCLQGGNKADFFHSFFSKTTLLFTTDPTIADLYQDATRLGDRDRAARLLAVVSEILPSLTKAEKWCFVKRDWHYAFLWILRCVNGLAGLEVLLHGQIMSREVLAQALPFNPEFFGEVYHGLIEGPKDEPAITGALAAINRYLDERPEIFRPILDYLQDSNGPRSGTEISHHFEMHYGFESAESVCEWLADRGKIEKIGVPGRLTAKSRVTVEEAGYYFGG